MSTKQPKQVDITFKELNRDVFKLINKGKLSFILIFMILFMYSCSLWLLEGKLKDLIQEPHILVFGVDFFYIFYLTFLFIFSCSFQEILKYNYTNKKVSFLDSVDLFLNSFKNFKIILQSIRHEIVGSSLLILCFTLITLPFTSSLHDFLNIFNVKKDLYSQIINFTSGQSFLLVFYICITQFYGIEKSKICIFMYLNMFYFNLNKEEAGEFTLEGLNKNEKLFKKINFLYMGIIWGIILIPIFKIFSLLFLMYIFFLLHCLWQRIFNDQDGVTAKETVTVNNINLAME